MTDSSNKLKLYIKFCQEMERRSFLHFFCVFTYREDKGQEFRPLLFLITPCRYSFLFSPGCLGEQGYVRWWLMEVFLITLLQSPNLHFTLSLLRENTVTFQILRWLATAVPAGCQGTFVGESSVSHKILSSYFASSFMHFPEGAHKKNMSFNIFHWSIQKMTQKPKKC